MSGGVVFGPEPFGTARQLVEERFERHGMTVYLGDAEGVARDLAGGLLFNAPPRAAELMAEQVIIAVAMRQQYGEADLTAGEVEQYVEGARAFLNSFWHDPL
ncbi:hypothetical protein [Kribbella sp. NPDC049227]|uniref:hypothetical protein n=1 Tax=Kribbella sp. NPDC049227 TaxID=3364113 RepID=UPI0037174871